MAALIFLLLPAFVLAGIEIELSGKFNGESSNMVVHFSGSEVDVISDEERVTFGLNDDTLKDAVKAYFGKRPTDVYLRSPTPWDDLYKRYGWSQVLRTFEPKSGRILNITSEPQIVLRQIFDYNSTNPAIQIYESVENKLTSKWFKSGDLSLGQAIKYKFNFEGMNVGGSKSLSHTAFWGEEIEMSQNVTVGGTPGMHMMLQPAQTVLAELQATKGSIRMEVEYEATLSGSVAVNYEDTYKGHYFWAPDIQGVMAAGFISNRLPSKQIIDIGFYADAEVVLHIRSNSTKLMDVSY